MQKDKENIEFMSQKYVHLTLKEYICSVGAGGEGRNHCPLIRVSKAGRSNKI